MSVITELFENYDHIPVEFRRHLYLIRELDESNSRLIQERENLKKEIMKKNVLDDEEQRTRLYDRIQQIYAKIDSQSEEKIELVEKLFLMQENFIRKLDQQIEKTEEDKHVVERCNQDLAGDEADLPAAFQQKLPLKKKNIQKPVYAGYGKGGEIATSFNSSFDSSSMMIGTKKSKNTELYGSKIDSSFGQLGKKRDRAREKKNNLISSSFDSNNQSSFIIGGVGNTRRGTLPSQFGAFSQDESLADNFDREDEDEDICYMCNMKKPNENWIQCDQCDKWFHYGCVGITQDNVPSENDKYYCPNCKRLSGSQLKVNRGYSEFGTNILDDQ